MTRRAWILWTAVAAIFAVLNLGGAVFAAVAAEPLHALAHVFGALIGTYFAWRWSPWRAAGRGEPGEIPAGEGEYASRLSQIEESVNAVAIEVERIGEGQRFMTRVLTDEGRQKPARDRAAEPVANKPPTTPPDVRRD